MDAAAATRVGAGMLGEIEEASLDEVLASLRASVTTPTTTSIGGNASDVNTVTPSSYKIKEYPFPPLNDLVQRHFRATQSAPLAVSGRHLPLLYSLIATLIAPPHNKAVLVVDMDGCFEISRILSCTPFPPNLAPQATHADQPPRTLRPSDLNHVYVARPARGDRIHTSEAVASAQDFMLYAAHGSRSREWWGTLVVGGGVNPSSSSTSASGGQPPTAAVVDVTAAWKGWLRVDRAEVRGFGAGVSVEEALAARTARGDAVDAAGWVARSVWGEFGFGG